MTISAIVQHVRQRVRIIKKRLTRGTGAGATVTTALVTADPAVTDNDDDTRAQDQLERENEWAASYRSTPLIDRSPASLSPISLQGQDRTSTFSFRRTPSAEILSVAPDIQDDGTLQNSLDLTSDSTALSITNPDPPASPTPDLSTAESFRATTPSLRSPAQILPFEQEESAEETLRKRKAALRMLEGDIPAVASGAYVRI